MQNPDNKHSTFPGVEPSTSEFRGTTGPNESSGPADLRRSETGTTGHVGCSLMGILKTSHKK